MNVSFHRIIILSVAILYSAWMSANFDLDKMFPNLIVTRHHYNQMKKEISRPANNKVKYAYVTLIKNEALSVVETNKKPTPFVSLTNNPGKINADVDMQIIYKLCVTYLFSGEQVYLDKAVEYLRAWAENNVAVTNYNIHETVYTPAVEGYSIIRQVISEESRRMIDGWVEARGNVFLRDGLRDNNWGTALLHQCLAYGRCIGKTTFVNKFKNSYATWAPKNLYPNGTTTDLIGRDAFAYHVYDLLFFGKIGYVIAMYEGWDAADNFYVNDVQWGASVKKSVHFLIPFLMDPAKNTHVEFVETEWAGDKNRADYSKKFNPAGGIYAIDELFFFDKENLQPVIDKYRGGNNYGQWRLLLSSLRYLYGDAEVVN